MCVYGKMTNRVFYNIVLCIDNGRGSGKGGETNARLCISIVYWANVLIAVTNNAVQILYYTVLYRYWRNIDN